MSGDSRVTCKQFCSNFLYARQNRYTSALGWMLTASIRFVVRGLWSEVCGKRSVVRGLWSEVCSQRSVARGLWLKIWV